MGVDLEVLPIIFSNMDWWLGNNRLGFTRNYALQDAVKALEPLPLPATVTFSYYHDDGVKDCLNDAYDSPLRYLRAKQFTPIGVNPAIETSQWNQAVLAMLAALPPDTPVVLYWH